MPEHPNYNENYQPVIGLEIHIQLKTRSRMFGSASNEIWGAEPNSMVSPVDLGLPGALPIPNATAIAWTHRLGRVLDCHLNKESKFDRKNYFYPDLPKGYQISQYDQPLCGSGLLKIPKEIRIRRIHLEEDTGKSMHKDGQTYLDFNKSGVPLVELVTEPDFASSAECSEFAKMVQEAARTLGISDVDMEKGQMRLEANISVRRVGERELPGYRVEVKNINSFKFMRDAIEYEIDRQISALEAGERLVQETRGWNERQKATIVQRTKEEAHDYRYFPEPDIPPLEFNEEYFAEVLKDLPEMPWVREKNLIDQGVRADRAKVVAYNKEKYTEVQTLAAKTLPEKIKLDELVNIVINAPDLSQVEGLVEKQQSLKDKPGLTSEQVRELAQQAIAENPQAVTDYHQGKTAVIKFLLGQVMQKSRGQADPGKAEETLVKLLK